MTNIRQYELFFFDNLVQDLIHERIPTVEAKFAEWITEINDKLKDEYQNFRVRLKGAILVMERKKDLRLFISHHYAEILEMLNNLELCKQTSEWYQRVKGIVDPLIEVLREIQHFFDQRFGRLLGQQRQLSNIYTQEQLGELMRMLNSVENHIPKCDLAKLLLKHCYEFIENQQTSFEVNMKALEYMRVLISTLTDWNWTLFEGDFCPLERLVVYMNINSKAIINVILNRIKRKISQCEHPDQQMLLLLNHRRIFKQLHRKPRVILNPNYHTVDDFINNWLEAEISFAEFSHAVGTSHMTLNRKNLEAEIKPETIKKPTPTRVLCLLSADQISLILRALDEAKVVESRSLNQVYNSIVPHLSTRFSKELSASSVRVKSYTAGLKDKEFVIQKLNKMINLIERY